MSVPTNGRKFPPEPLGREEVDSLIGACSLRASTGIRNRAIIAVLWRGAMRIGETLALRESDVDFARCTIRVLHGKGDKSRLVVVDRGTIELVQAWMRRRVELGIGSGPLFCTLAGGSIDPGDMRKTLHLRARKAGIKKRVHPHGLRHTGASELAADGVPLLEIAAQLGHSSPATTARYLHLLNPEARISRLSSREW